MRFDAVWPLPTKRIDKLNAAALIALEEECDTNELLDTVYGDWLIDETRGEVSRG